MPTHWKLYPVCATPCSWKLPCHWILLTISHHNHQASWKLSLWSKNPRSGVSSPTASSVKTFARTKIGMDLQILEASSFSQFLVCLFKTWFWCKSWKWGFQCKSAFMKGIFHRLGSGMWKLKGGEMLESVRHSSSGGKRRLYLLWADCWCGTNSQKEYSSIESVVFLNKLISEDQIKSWSSPWLNVNCIFQHMSH